MKSETGIVIEDNELAKHIMNSFNRGLDGFAGAGEGFVRLLEQRPDAYEFMVDKSNGMLTRPMLSTFERIGRKQLDPKLIAMSGSGPEKLRRMPLSLQQECIKNPIDVLILVDDGTSDVLKVSLQNLTGAQTNQVFNRDSMRDLAAQRAWLEDERERRAAAAKPEYGTGYRIKGRTVTFLENTTLTAKELVAILSQIER